MHVLEMHVLNYNLGFFKSNLLLLFCSSKPRNQTVSKILNVKYKTSHVIGMSVQRMEQSKDA